MLKNLKQFLTKNLWWKLFSIIAAIVLWGIVINITNPSETRQFFAKVKFVNEDTLTKRNLTIANKSDIEDTRIAIAVKGKKMALDNLERNQSKISATIDLQSSIYGITIDDPNNIPIKVSYSGNDNFQTVSTDPETLKVIFEEIKTITKEVQIRAVGEPAADFVTLSPQISPSTVQITGASSAIAKVDTVKVSVDTNGLSETLSTKGKPEAYDINDKLITGLEISSESVDVVVPVNKYKKIPITTTIEGIPEDGYSLVSVTTDIEIAEVVGEEADIDKFNELVLNKINISGFNQTRTITYDLRKDSNLPSNINIKNGTPNQVNVTINIAKEGLKQFAIPVENIAVSGASTHQFSFNQQNVIINLNGLENTINKIASNNIKCSIDLNGYEEGTHNVPLKISVPSNTTLIGNPTVNITITSVQQTTEAESQTEANTTTDISTETESTTSTEQSSDNTDETIPVNATEATEQSTEQNTVE